MFPYPVKSRLKFYNFLLFFILTGGSVFGQLNADFTLDQTGGCSPLVVTFTNRTTGASANATYRWDFGNGNSSALQQAATVYTDVQTYTITLTVQDGANQSITTREVNVYKPPTADFSVDAFKVCLGNPSVFTATANGAGAPIASYTWDFGDGSTTQSGSTVQPHQYGSVQLASVSLTVGNVYGCHTTVNKQNIVNVIPALIAGFTADKRVLCLVTDAVQFTNSSSGPGTLDYLWDFADGTSSTATDPGHTFNKKGLYSVSLKVHSSEGCTVTSTQSNPLNVASYSTSFSASSPTCAGSGVLFTSTSSPVPDNIVWQVDGVNSGFYYGSYFSFFYVAGDHTITLNNTFGDCPQSASQQITIHPLPVPGVFSADVQGICGAPVIVKFKDQTPGALSWQWNFNAYGSYNGGTYVQGTSSQQAPSFTYLSNGPYEISVQVTDANGCSASTYQGITLVSPSAGIIPGTPIVSTCNLTFTNTFGTTSSDPLKTTNWNFGDGTTSTAPNPTHTFNNTNIFSYTVTLNYTTVSGCTGSASTIQYTIPPTPVRVDVTAPTFATCLTSITAVYSYETQDPLTTTNWNFGDGSTSAVASPSHTYAAIGTFLATLNYVTQDGCKGSVTALYPITIDPKVNIKFTENPNPVCGNTLVSFVASGSTPDNRVYNWNFGDGGLSFGDQFNPTHHYGASGDYTVSLYVRNLGGCDTMLSQPIHIDPPFPYITGHTNTCDGTRGTVTFTQASVQATTVTWNFGDGTTATTPGTQTTITHIYQRTGTYNASLTATNGACSLVVGDPYPVYIFLKQSPLLTGNQSSVCTDGSVPIVLSRIEESPYQLNNLYGAFYSGYYSLQAQYRDGTPFTGAMAEPYVFGGYIWTTQLTATLSNFQPREKDIRLIMTSYGFGCNDTSSFMPLVIKGAVSGFEIQSDHLCYQSRVLLKDTSSTTGNNPILSWTWIFGDGQSVTKSTGGALTHNYVNPGSYQVSMQIKDAAGCSPVTPYTQTVIVNGPKASFSPSGTDVHLNTTVFFNNTTNDYGNTNTVYNWDFGDGSPISHDPFPFHTYPIPGTYTVTMTATNPSLPCSSTATPVTIIVRNFNSAFAFSTYYVSGGCAPLLVNFTNTSFGYQSVDWDFGDGLTVGNLNYASHVYERPGKYIVTLNVHGFNGIEGKFIDSIIIREPTVSLGPLPPEACIGDTVKLFSTGQNTASFIWDFGDGSVIPSPTGDALHQYLTAGSYTATVLVKNASGCTVDTTLPSPVKVRPNPIITLSPPSPVILCKDATVNLKADGDGTIYQWIPATGLSDPSIPDPVASPEITTNYTIKVKDDIGCRNTATLTIQVIPPGNLQVSKDDTVCAGESVKLTATGETLYEWIDNTTGLNRTDIPDPVALAPSTTTYTIKGSDAYFCFVDQKDVTVTVRPLPTVNAGPNVLVEAGYNTLLDAIGSSDVVSYNWQPTRYLSCYDCSSPLCTPLATTPYYVVVKNQYGCKASDTVVVAVDCQESHVRIPNAFTPDGNGVNDVFIIKGISIIKHMVIFDRWGEKVYERNDFIAGDRPSCWDGTYKGHKCATGAYVYFVEMECPAGGLFSRQGSFVLVR